MLLQALTTALSEQVKFFNHSLLFLLVVVSVLQKRGAFPFRTTFRLFRSFSDR